VFNFKLYYTDAAGHVLKRIDLECESEEAAIAVAEEHAVDRRIELWDGSIRVRVIEASAKP
jgi:hypothetical protein